MAPWGAKGGAAALEEGQLIGSDLSGERRTELSEKENGKTEEGTRTRRWRMSSRDIDRSVTGLVECGGLAPNLSSGKRR